MPLPFSYFTLLRCVLMLFRSALPVAFQNDSGGSSPQTLARALPWITLGLHPRLPRVDRALAALHAPCTLTCTSTGSTSTSPGNFPKIRPCTLALGTGCMVGGSKVAQTGTYKHFTVLRVMGIDSWCQKT